MWESIREPHLWIHPYFFDSAPCDALFVLFEWFVRWEASGCTSTVLWYLLPGFVEENVHSSDAVSIKFFLCAFLSVHEVHPHSSMDTSTVWKKPHFILSDWSDFHMIDSVSMAFAKCMLISCISAALLTTFFCWASGYVISIKDKRSASPLPCAKHMSLCNEFWMCQSCPEDFSFFA